MNERVEGCPCCYIWYTLFGTPNTAIQKSCNKSYNVKFLSFWMIVFVVHHAARCFYYFVHFIYINNGG